MPTKCTTAITIPRLSCVAPYRSALRWLQGLNPRGLQALVSPIAALVTGLLRINRPAICVALAVGGA